ncbi:MAG: AtpZ/AtpI family protein [Pseudomonadota bacterium]
MGRFISEQTRDYLRMLARVSSMGISMVLATIMGFGLGYWVDTWWNGATSPWGKLVGLIIGIVAGYRNIYIIMKRSKYL